MNYTYVGTVLVQNNGDVLAQHRDNVPTIAEPNKWGICGGKSEEVDPTDKAAAARELFEETGYKVDPDSLQELAKDEFSAGGDYVTRRFYWARYDGRQEIGCFEGQEIVFVPLCDLKKLDFCDPFHVEYLEKASRLSSQTKLEGNSYGKAERH